VNRSVASAAFLGVLTCGVPALGQEGGLCAPGHLELHDVLISIDPETPCLDVEVEVNPGCPSGSISIHNDCDEELLLPDGVHFYCAEAAARCSDLAPGDTASESFSVGADQGAAELDRTYDTRFGEEDVIIHVTFGATFVPPDESSGCGCGEPQSVGAVSRPPLGLAAAIPWIVWLRRRRSRG
jgi:hypothetical protein